ncbi:hypothetical protein LCGC14_0984230 [marine sediment metagenome]|uniref:Uncharacterized protein n=1 Tax=marine sediment metagenome TaxID=412755 RepID=A0A0F9NU38_9ZZZZ|nr:hypothetical protein [Bacteroides sp.]
MPKHNKNQYSLQQVYQWYKNSVNDPVDYKTHKLVLEVWGTVFSEYILAGKDIKLQQGLSVLGVRKKEKHTYVDRRASKLAGKLVLKPNTHSGFYGANVYWRRHYTVCNSKGWVLRPCRKLSRALGVIMKQPYGHTRYVKRAMVSRKEEHRKAFYNKKVLKL